MSPTRYNSINIYLTRNLYVADTLYRDLILQIKNPLIYLMIEINLKFQLQKIKKRNLVDAIFFLIN